jgi:hypothetical protein
VLRPDLDPLRGLLIDRRRRERRRMVRALRSARAGSLFADWPAFLEGLVESPQDGRPDAGRPIVAVAGDRIAVVYRRIVRAGGAIDDASPPEPLHELGKAGRAPVPARVLRRFYPDTVVGRWPRR